MTNLRRSLFVLWDIAIRCEPRCLLLFLTLLAVRPHHGAHLQAEKYLGRAFFDELSIPFSISWPPVHYSSHPCLKALLRDIVTPSMNPPTDSWKFCYLPAFPYGQPNKLQFLPLDNDSIVELTFKSNGRDRDLDILNCRLLGPDNSVFFSISTDSLSVTSFKTCEGVTFATVTQGDELLVHFPLAEQQEYESLELKEPEMYVLIFPHPTFLHLTGN